MAAARETIKHNLRHNPDQLPPRLQLPGTGCSDSAVDEWLVIKAQIDLQRMLVRAASFSLSLLGHPTKLRRDVTISMSEVSSEAWRLDDHSSDVA
jgi:hypothetical protein